MQDEDLWNRNLVHVAETGLSLSQHGLKAVTSVRLRVI